MPSRNTVREYDTPAYYHVYNRGAGGARIFRDAQDKRKFMTLLERYLVLKDNEDYPTYDIELLAFCVMGNHYHLLLYQENDRHAISGLMRSLSTAYSMYYNLRYKNHGHVFQSVFKASKINDEAYLTHISRYIHLNPETYQTYKWSSLQCYLGKQELAWVKPEKLLDMTAVQYSEFLADYKDRRLLLKQIHEELAL